MKRVEILNRLEKTGVVAVNRANSKEEALKSSHAAVKGGLTGIELTFTVTTSRRCDSRISNLL